MSNWRRKSGLTLVVLLCVPVFGCGGGKDGKDGKGDDGGNHGNSGNGAPDAGNRPIGAGQEGQAGKRARGGPIDVPDINLVGRSIDEVKEALSAAIRPQCPGNTLCVSYTVVGTDQGPCYGGELTYEKPLLPGGTITIHAGTICSTPGVGESEDPGGTGEPSEGSSAPVNPPVPSSAPS